MTKKNTAKKAVADKKDQAYRRKLRKESLARGWRGAEDVVAVNVGPGERGGWRPDKGITQGVAAMAETGYGKWPIACHVEGGDRVVFVLAPETRLAMGTLNELAVRHPDGIAEAIGAGEMSDADVAATIGHDAFVAGELAGYVLASATVDHVDARGRLASGTEVSVATLVDVKPVEHTFKMPDQGYRYPTMAARRIGAGELFAAEAAAIERGFLDAGNGCFPLSEMA